MFSGSASWDSYDVASVELGGELGMELVGEEKNEETEEEKELRDPTFRLRWTQDHLCQRVQNTSSCFLHCWNQFLRSFALSVPAKFVDNQIESEDESELNIDLDMLQVSLALPIIFQVNFFRRLKLLRGHRLCQDSEEKMLRKTSPLSLSTRSSTLENTGKNVLLTRNQSTPLSSSESLQRSPRPSPRRRRTRRR